MSYSVKIHDVQIQRGYPEDNLEGVGLRATVYKKSGIKMKNRFKLFFRSRSSNQEDLTLDYVKKKNRDSPGYEKADMTRMSFMAMRTAVDFLYEKAPEMGFQEEDLPDTVENYMEDVETDFPGDTSGD